MSHFARDSATGPQAKRLSRLVRSIAPASAARPEDVRRHLDTLTKPVGSLGEIENLALRLSMIYGDPPPEFDHVTIFIGAADHGVADRGVSAYPKQVTAQMCRTYVSGKAAINVFARLVGASVVVADFGVDADLSDVADIVNVKIRRGTRDLSRERAMTLAEAREAILRGAELVERQSPIPDLVAVGEMGIGNTTAASAITAALTSVDPEQVTGPGTGIGPAALQMKTELIRRALHRVRATAGPLRILGEVGGLEIAGLVGVILASAGKRRAIIVDGFIATAAAAIAVRLCPMTTEYLIASHRSREPGHGLLLDNLRLRTGLDLGMRLGEGTGAALFIPIVKAAGAILREMATFDSAGVSSGVTQ